MSTLSVNNITTQTGSTITVPSGKTLIAPNHVLQTVNQVNNAGVTLSNANTTKFMEQNFTTKVANSAIIVRFYTSIYRESTATGNRDADVSMGMGFKTGASTSASSDYTAITTYAPSRQNITFASSAGRAFYSSDAYSASGSYDGRYSPITTVFNEESFSPSLAAGTTIRIAVFVNQDYNTTSNIKFGSSASGSGDSGGTSCLTITEVAPS